MAHKDGCPKKADASAECTLNCEAKTKFCDDCGAEIGATDKKCPKCQADLELAAAEDEIVNRSLKRAENRKKRTPAPAPAPAPGTPPKKKHPFSGLKKIFDK